MSLRSTWLSAAHRGFSSLVQGELNDALAHWRTARSLAVNEEKLGSPCLVFVHNNCGVAALLLKDFRGAQDCFQNALISLERSAERLSSEEVNPFAASSSHQLRLALRHAEAFGEAHRRRLTALLDAQREIVRANAATHATSSTPADVGLIARGLGDRSLSALLARGDKQSPDALSLILEARESLTGLASDLLSWRGPPSFPFLIERSAELTLFADPLLAWRAETGAFHHASPLHHKEP